MRKVLNYHWKAILAGIALAIVMGSIIYAGVTQALKNVPATATFVAGVELASDNIAATYDSLGNDPISASKPLGFGTIPNFGDLRLWSPFNSKCIYIHNRSDQANLGPPTTLVVNVVSTEAENLGGGLGLVKAEKCGDPAHPGETPLTQRERTVAPGETLRARVQLDLTRSPGEGLFNFVITVGGTFVPLTLGVDLRPTAMEVSQGIQNLANDMPLVEDRRTIVRVYVDNAALIAFDLDVSSVRARLYASRGGSNLSGSPINAMNNPITVKADGGDRRELDDSFWFYIPSGWRSGTVEFRAEIDYLETVGESNETNNETSTTVTFHDAQTFNMVLVPIHLHLNGGTHIFWGTESYRWDLYNNMYRLHPISDLDMWRFTSSLKRDSHSSGSEWDMTVKDDRSDMLGRIWWKDSKTTDWASELHYMGGVEAATDTSGVLGSAYTSGTDRQSWVKMWNIHDGYPDWYLKGGNSMAHEQAHNEGRIHVNCSGSEKNPDPGYPYPNPNCNIAAEDDQGWFGLDVYYTKWGFSEPAVIDNTIDGSTDLDAYPLWGYKRPRWIDPYTYCALLNRYGVTCSLTSFGPVSQEPQPGPVPAHAQSVLGADRLVTVLGYVSETGDQGRLAIIDLQNKVDVFQDTIDKWVKRQQIDSKFPYRLDVVSASQQVIHSQPISRLDSSEEEGPFAFAELVPWTADAATLVLRANTTELDRRTASPNPPTIQVLEPGPGILPPGPQTIRVRWQASDPDNDKLTYNVMYSPDNGLRWEPVALGVAGTEYVISLAGC